jgi:hypothetical protein
MVVHFVNSLSASLGAASADTRLHAKLPLSLIRLAL